MQWRSNRTELPKRREWRSLAYPDDGWSREGVQSPSHPLNLRNTLNGAFAKYTVHDLLLYSLNPHFLQETLKNFALRSHFASASGEFVLRGFGLDLTGGLPFPDTLAGPPPHRVNSFHCKILGTPMVKAVSSHRTANGAAYSSAVRETCRPPVQGPGLTILFIYQKNGSGKKTEKVKVTNAIV